MVNKYLNNSEMYGIFENGKCICEVIITEVDSDTCKLKNISTDIEYRGNGYASKIIKFVFEI